MRFFILSLMLILSVNAVDIIDYDTGEVVTLNQCCDRHVSTPLAEAVVDQQSLATESMAEYNFDNTSTAALWEHGPVWSHGG